LATTSSPWSGATRRGSASMTIGGRPTRPRALRPALARDACEIVPLDDGRVLCLSRTPRRDTRAIPLGSPEIRSPGGDRVRVG